jgi:Zn-dependent M28 family amino/carboxypeptidase
MGATILAIVAGLLLAVFTLATLVVDSPGALAVELAPVLGGLSALALFTLAILRNGNRSPGGVDNAGSLSIVLDLARTLPAQVPDDVELVFLSPGAEEDHMVGAMRWLDRHRPETLDRPVYTINIDGAGNPTAWRSSSATVSAAASPRPSRRRAPEHERETRADRGSR